jgi:hypothetical protein
VLTVILYPATSGTSPTATQESLFQLFQWFDGLTMSGFILNRFARFITEITLFHLFQWFQSFHRCAPFKALRRFEVQGSRVQRELSRFENSRNAEVFTPGRTIARH